MSSDIFHDEVNLWLLFPAHAPRVLFHTPAFALGFLPIALIAFFLCGRYGGHRAAMLCLVLFSLTFYGWWNPIHVPLLLGSLAANLFFARRIAARPSSRAWLTGGIAFNLLLLGWFKYADFAAQTVAPDSPRLNIALPLAISFFTFQQIMFLTDSRTGRISGLNPLSYVACITFFPHIVAGPIVRPAEIMPQFAAADLTRPNRANLTEGLSLFLLGLAKKLVLADLFGRFADTGFDAAEQNAALTFFEAWYATLAYALQIYFDFSGYSDMAIGLALMFNIRFPLNFLSPYQARDIGDFWRRWHITLGQFLRDHVYIPLGGNRAGPARYRLNLVLTMLIGGLWHGAAWKFVLWGGIHGVLLALLPLGRSRLFVLLAVVLSWVPFRADSLPAAWAMARGLLGLNGIALPTMILDAVPTLGLLVDRTPVLPYLGDARTLSFPEVTVCLLLGWTIVLFAPQVHALSLRARRWAIAAGFALTVQAMFFAPRVAPFLYFQF